MKRHSPHGRSRHWSKTLWRHYVWMALFTLALFVFGGGTRTALTTDFVLQLLALPLIWRMMMRFPDDLPGHWRVLILASILLFVWQLIPWPGKEGWRFPNTLDAGTTLQSFFIFLVALAYFYNALILPTPLRERLVDWLLLAVVLNVMVSFLQFASPAFAAGFQPFAWKISAGFFANDNHFAILLAASVPFIVARFQRTAWPWLAWLAVVLLVSFEIVVGSRAGVMLVMVSALVSAPFVQARSTAWTSVVILSLVGMILLAFMLFPASISWEFTLNGAAISRGIFLYNTGRAILDHLPFGTGIGTFTFVYPKYEMATGITNRYVNHAHNDWLELLLEGGLPALLLLIGFLFALSATLIANRPLTAYQRAALIACAALMLHSLVDYPLRTLALACVFALCTALMLANPSSAAGSSRA